MLHVLCRYRYGEPPSAPLRMPWRTRLSLRLPIETAIELPERGVMIVIVSHEVVKDFIDPDQAFLQRPRFTSFSMFAKY
jgi:hypothetical protein